MIAFMGDTLRHAGPFHRIISPDAAIETTETGSIVNVDPSDAIRVYRLGR